MESIVKYLRVKLGANIATLKSKFADLERNYSGNEYYEEFMGIINKAEYSIEDINDLLLCYSDHDLSLEEILSLVVKDEPIYYDKHRKPLRILGENEYVNELRQFFDELNGEVDTIYGFEDDLDVLALIDEVEGI